MQITKIILVAMPMSLAIGSPIMAERGTDVPSSVLAAEAMGVDVYGPIPNDYTWHENGTYFSAVGSKANAWVRAQIDLPASGHEKRQGYANIGIGMFAQDNCNGESAWFDDVIYGNQNILTNDYILNFYAVGISYRGLRSNEQLDFSKYSNGDMCGQYLYSAGYETPVGCFASQAINCFRLTEH